MMKISKVVVIGSGTMGSGIAAQVANAGLQVQQWDYKFIYWITGSNKGS